jgi:hypothetical protein
MEETSAPDTGLPTKIPISNSARMLTILISDLLPGK